MSRERIEQNKDSLSGNVHNKDKLPNFHHNSAFFTIANRLEEIGEDLTEFIKPERNQFKYGKYLHLTFHILPEYGKEVPLPSAYVLDTPENNAITIGRFAPNAKKDLTFQLARFHVGYPAQKDMAIAMQQASELEEIKSLIANLDDPEEQMYITYLTREGHLTDWHGAMFKTWKVNIPFTQAHVEHSKDESENNKFKRVSKVCPINFEGMTPTQTSLLVLGDNTASGMQQIAVLEETIDHIRRSNGGDHHIKDILVVSPLLTLYGMTAISYYASKEGIRSTFICSGAILDSNPPLRYYSPVSSNENLIPDPRIIQVNHLSYGEKAAGKADPRCNWTASFTAPRYALERSNEELKFYGSSNQEVLESSARVTPEVLQQMGIDPNRFMPHSTSR